MKHAATLIGLLVLVLPLPAQNWQWVRTAGGGSIQQDLAHHGVQVLETTNGKIICVGNYSGNFSFNNTIAAQGAGVFWGMYDAVGNRENFVFGETGTGQYASADIFGDKHGGYFAAGGINTGGFTVDTVPVAAGYWAKFSEENRAIWGRTLSAAPNARHATIRSLDFDDSGHIYMTGLFDGIDNYLDTAVLHNQDGLLKYKFFVARFDSAAHLEWVKQCYGGNNYIGRCFWRNNKLYTLVSAGDSCMSFDNLTFCPEDHPDSAAVSILELEPTNGDVVWHRELLSQGPAGIYSFADVAGNTYYAGAFDSVISFDTITMTRQGLHAGYLVKFDTLGHVKWGRQYYSTDLLTIYNMHTDSAGNTCIVGSFRGDLYWSGNIFHNSGFETMFVTRYNTDGKYLGTVVVADAVARGVTQDRIGNIIVTGHTTGASSTTMFGDLPVESSGNARFFVGKLDNITGLSFKTEEQESLKIFANPNSGQFTIALPEGVVHEKQLALRISSLSGAEVYSRKMQLSNDQVQVDLGVIEKGTYTISLSGKNKQYTGLVVVQ